MLNVLRRTQGRKETALYLYQLFWKWKIGRSAENSFFQRARRVSTIRNFFMSGRVFQIKRPVGPNHYLRCRPHSLLSEVAGDEYVCG